MGTRFIIPFVCYSLVEAHDMKKHIEERGVLVKTRKDAIRIVSLKDPVDDEYFYYLEIRTDNIRGMIDDLMAEGFL